MAKQVQPYEVPTRFSQALTRLFTNVAIILVVALIFMGYTALNQPKVKMDQQIQQGRIKVECGLADQQIYLKTWSTRTDKVKPMYLLQNEGMGEYFKNLWLSPETTAHERQDYTYQRLVALTNTGKLLVWSVAAVYDKDCISGIKAELIRMKDLYLDTRSNIILSPDKNLLAYSDNGSAYLEEVVSGKRVLDLRGKGYQTYEQIYFGEAGELYAAVNNLDDQKEYRDNCISIVEYIGPNWRPKVLLKTKYHSSPKTIKRLGNWLVLHYEASGAETKPTDLLFNLADQKESYDLVLSNASWDEPMVINDKGTLLVYIEHARVYENERYNGRVVHLIYLGNHKPEEAMSDRLRLPEGKTVVTGLMFSHDNVLEAKLRLNDDGVSLTSWNID